MTLKLNKLYFQQKLTKICRYVKNEWPYVK